MTLNFYLSNIFPPGIFEIQPMELLHEEQKVSDWYKMYSKELALWVSLSLENLKSYGGALRFIFVKAVVQQTHHG